MPRHRGEEQTSLKRPLAIVLALAVVALAIYGIVQAVAGGDTDDGMRPTAGTADEGVADDGVAQAGAGPAQTATDEISGTAPDDAVTSAAPSAAPCTETHQVSVLAAPDIAPVVAQIAEQADPCIAYTVTAQAPIEVVSAFSTGRAPEAQVWIPSSVGFADALSDAGVQVETGPVVATSPVVLAAARTVFEEATAGLPDEPTWADLVTAELPLVVGSPQTDPPSSAVLLAAQVGLGDSDAARVLTENLMVTLAQNAAADPLAAVGQGLPVFVPTTAGQVAASAETDTELAGLTPRGGAGTLSYPYVVLPGGTDVPGVAELQEALLSSEARTVFSAGGFSAGEADAVPVDPAALAALHETWGALNPPSRLLAVIDVSGSMDEVVGESSRIGITSQAAQRGLALFPDDSAVGLWAFATSRGAGGEDWVEMLPVRVLSEDVDGATQRALLQAASQTLDEDFTTGDTGLHDTVLAAYLHMQAEWEEGFVSSIVLLTDGVNDDSTGGLSESELIAELQAAADPEREVRLILIGMGPDVDSAALTRVATAVGGQSFVAEDPRDIGQVFIRAIAARHG